MWGHVARERVVCKAMCRDMTCLEEGEHVDNGKGKWEERQREKERKI